MVVGTFSFAVARAVKPPVPRESYIRGAMGLPEPPQGTPALPPPAPAPDPHLTYSPQPPQPTLTPTTPRVRAAPPPQSAPDAAPSGGSAQSEVVPDDGREEVRAALPAPTPRSAEISDVPPGDLRPPAVDAPCLVCGSPSVSWIERDGERKGFCRAHIGTPERPVPVTASAPPTPPIPSAPLKPPGPPPGEARQGGAVASGEPAAPTTPERSGGASQQCSGVTKSGTRCRRKTRDPSGFCYQHQPPG